VEFKFGNAIYRRFRSNHHCSLYVYSRVRLTPQVRDAGYRLIHVGNDNQVSRILIKKLNMATKTARAYHKAGNVNHAKEFFTLAQLANEALQKVKNKLSTEDGFKYLSGHIHYLEERADLAFSQQEVSTAGFFMKQAQQLLQDALNQVGDKEERKVQLAFHAASMLKTLLHFGQDCIAREVYADAIVWLKDAFSLNAMVDADETLDKICHAGVTSFDIYRSLAVAHLHTKNPDRLKQAENAVNLALDLQGGDVVSLATKLELFVERQERADDVLMNLAQDAHMESQKDVDLALGCLHRVAARVPRPLILDACVKMLVNLYESGYGEFAEKVIATGCHFASDLEGVDASNIAMLVEKLRLLFREMQRFNAQLCDDNRQISQLVIWQCADLLFQNDMALEALRYYETSQALLGPKDDINKKVLQRKILLCLTVAKESDKAKDLVHGLDANDATTCFFGFHIALDEGDWTSCLAWIARAGELEGEDVVSTINTMCHVAIKRQQKPIVKACLDSMLKWHKRKGIGLGPKSLVIFRSQLKLERNDPNGISAEVLQHLEVVNAIMEQPVAIEEVEWFFTTCWNLGLKASESQDNQMTSALFKFAYQFSLRVAKHHDFEKSTLGDLADVRMHQCIALLISSTALIDGLRMLVGEFQKEWETLLQDIEVALTIAKEYRNNEMVDIGRLMVQFSALKFECLLQLQRWNDVKDVAVEACEWSQDAKMLERFAHLVLCDDACPSGVQFAVIRSAFHVATRFVSLSPVRFAQWFRALVVRFFSRERILTLFFRRVLPSTTRLQHYQSSRNWFK
jgi:hypothetical protein